MIILKKMINHIYYIIYIRQHYRIKIYNIKKMINYIYNN